MKNFAPRGSEEVPPMKKPMTARGKALSALLILCCAVTLVSQRAQLRQSQAQADRLTDRAAQISQELRDLNAQLDGAGTPEGIAEIAREQEGLALPGEIIFIDKNH